MSIRRLIFGVNCFLWVLCFKVKCSDSSEEDCEADTRFGDKIRLIDTQSQASKHLEVCVGGVWHRTCNYTFNCQSAVVACRQLGFAGGHFVNATSIGLSSGDVALRAATCVGTESNLKLCHLENQDLQICKNRQLDIRIVCQNDKDVIKGIRLRGKDSVSGNLEVFADGRWNAVCGNGFTEDATRVACIQMGLRHAENPASISCVADPAGVGLGIDLSALKCSAAERFLQDCSKEEPTCTKFHSVACSRKETVQLKCEQDPDVIFFEPAFSSANSDQNEYVQKFRANSLQTFFFEVSGMSGHLLLLRTSTDFQSNLKIVLREFLHSAEIAGNYWTHFEHSVGICDPSNMSCSKIASKTDREPAADYRNWRYYSLTIRRDGSRQQLEIAAAAPDGSSRYQTLILTSTKEAVFEEIFHIYFCAATQSEVIYRVKRNNDVNRCCVKDGEESRARRCGDAFVDASLCTSCGCCYIRNMEPRCFVPFGTSSKVDEGKCNRTLAEVFSRTQIFINDLAVCHGKTVEFLVGLTTYHKSLRVQLETGIGNMENLLSFSEEINLPQWITGRNEVSEGGSRYWAVFNKSYERPGKFLVAVAFEADGHEKYVTPSRAVFVQSRNPAAQLRVNGDSLFENDDVEVLFVVENYKLQVDLTIETQDPLGTRRTDRLRSEDGSSLPNWFLKNLSHASSASDFSVTKEFKISVNMIGLYNVKVVANSSCFAALTTNVSFEVKKRPALRDVVGELRLLADDPHVTGFPLTFVLVVDKLSRNPVVKVIFGDSSSVDMLEPQFLHSQLPGFASRRINSTAELDWIAFNHTYSSIGSFTVSATYSDLKWTSPTEVIDAGVKISIECNFDITGAGRSRGDAFGYRRGETVGIRVSTNCSGRIDKAEWRIYSVNNDKPEEVTDASVETSKLDFSAKNLDLGVYVATLKMNITLRDNFKTISQDFWVEVVEETGTLAPTERNSESTTDTSRAIIGSPEVEYETVNSSFSLHRTDLLTVKSVQLLFRMILFFNSSHYREFFIFLLIVIITILFF